jgi:hypothetical protein
MTKRDELSLKLNHDIYYLFRGGLQDVPYTPEKFQTLIITGLQILQQFENDLDDLHDELDNEIVYQKKIK